MVVTIWSNGTGAYGIKVLETDRGKYFNKNDSIVNIEIDGKIIKFELSDSFWNDCRKIIGGVIQEWIISNNLNYWDNNNPPKVNLIFMEKNNFKLELL